MVNSMNDLDEIFQSLPNAPYLFLGSGFSKRYCEYAPSWRDLLQALAAETRPDAVHPLRSYEADAPREFSDNQRYAFVAGEIEEDYNRLFFSGTLGNEQEHLGINYDNNEKLSPFRQHLAAMIKKIVQRKDLPQELQDELSDLKQASKHCINGIITTNYDAFAETLFPDFDVFRGQDDLIVTRATGYAEIYKIHGDYRDPQTMVFSEKDYEGFEKRKAYLVSKLVSIFVENPLIIMGYSLKDENVRGIFDAIAGCLSCEKLRELGEHIIFIEYDEKQSTPLVTRWNPLEKNWGFAITQVKTNSFKPITTRMLKLRRRYPIHVLRKVRQDLYQTVVSNTPVDAIRVVSEQAVLTDESGSGLVVVGFSHENGYEPVHVSMEDTYRHVLNPAHPLNYTSFVEKWLPDNMKGTKYPVFFYLRKYLEAHGPSPLSDIVREHVLAITGLDSLLNNTLIKRKSLRPYSTVAQLEAVWDSIQDKYNKLALLDEEEYADGKLLNFLRKILEKKPTALGNTDFRRLVRICDYVENGAAVLHTEDGSKFFVSGGGDGSLRKSQLRGEVNPGSAPSENQYTTSYGDVKPKN